MVFTCLPRMRGDPPVAQLFNCFRLMSTPHARGSTPLRYKRYCRIPVYPACAGIHRYRRSLGYEYRSLPRMRGDPPFCFSLYPALFQSTPHARGSTVISVWNCPALYVYPACAGIHPNLQVMRIAQECLPRMRGDPPNKFYKKGLRYRSTPHARGSTQSLMPSR